MTPSRTQRLCSARPATRGASGANSKSNETGSSGSPSWPPWEPCSGGAAPRAAPRRVQGRSTGADRRRLRTRRSPACDRPTARCAAWRGFDIGTRRLFRRRDGCPAHRRARNLPRRRDATRQRDEGRARRLREPHRCLLFILVTHVDWVAVGLIGVGSMLRGMLGARAGRRLQPSVLRGVVVVVGLVALVEVVSG